MNERLDGSGYHRGLPGAAIPAPARILAAADAYQAMTEPRSSGRRGPRKEATAELSREVRDGRLASEAVEAVLAADGPSQVEAAKRTRRLDAQGGQGADPSRPRFLHEAGRSGPRHHREDGRHPYRTDLRRRPGQPPVPPRPSSRCSRVCSTRSAHPIRRVFSGCSELPRSLACSSMESGRDI